MSIVTRADAQTGDFGVRIECSRSWYEEPGFTTATDVVEATGIREVRTDHGRRRQFAAWLTLYMHRVGFWVVRTEQRVVAVPVLRQPVVTTIPGGICRLRPVQVSTTWIKLYFIHTVIGTATTSLVFLVFII